MVTNPIPHQPVQGVHLHKLLLPIQAAANTIMAKEEGEEEDSEETMTEVSKHQGCNEATVIVLWMIVRDVSPSVAVMGFK